MLEPDIPDLAAGTRLIITKVCSYLADDRFTHPGLVMPIMRYVIVILGIYHYAQI